MTTTTARTVTRCQFTDALEASGFNEYEIRDSYSGRFMNGSDCFGIVVDQSEERSVFVALGWACGHAEAQEEDSEMQMWERLIRSASVDSMGRDIIVYFPGWTLDA